MVEKPELCVGVLVGELLHAVDKLEYCVSPLAMKSKIVNGGNSGVIQVGAKPSFAGPRSTRRVRN